MTACRRVLAFFAPVDRKTGVPTIFDPGKPFDVDAPAAPWIAAGEVWHLRRTSAVKFGVLAAGPKGAVAGQFRDGLQARISFDFCTWGKLEMALSGGSQHLNVLEGEPNTSGTASGGAAQSPVAVLNGSSETELVLGIGSVDAFDVGDIVAVDVDYMQETGYVGSPIAAGYVKDPLDVKRDRDYLRRLTFNVAKVKEKTATSLVLDSRLAGGAPAEGALVQKVVAFVDREGGTFFQEWSGLFVVDAEDGGRACVHYPRLQTAAPASETQQALDSFTMHMLHAEFIALPVKDEVDGETVVCFRSYAPSVGLVQQSREAQ